MLAALIKKELLALVRDAHGLGAMFIMPVMFIIIMSLALKDVYDPPSRSLRYAIDARDPGQLAQSLQADWQRHHGAALPWPADWQSQLREGHLKYVLVFEPGLSDELAQPTLPTKARVQLLAEPGININLFNSLQAELTGAAGELKARTALANTDAPAQPPNASIQSLIDARRYASSGGPRPTAVQQNVPAWLVFGMFFVIASISNVFVQERSTGTLARLQSLGVSRFMLLASKALPYLGVNALQAVLMLAVGVWLMPLLGGQALSLAGIHWDALVLAIAAIGVAAVSMSLALACAVRTYAQAAATGPILNVLMAAIGGIMVPKFMMPAAMQRVAELSPMNWGLEALLTVLLRGGTIASTLPHVAHLLGFAVLMVAVAWLLFRRPAR
ncbi:MAG TPA: ABC transporter permease [Rhizobacter sp.]|nr:ABC transporter permease [Rhizobacter sp.]